MNRLDTSNLVRAYKCAICVVGSTGLLRSSKLTGDKLNAVGMALWIPYKTNHDHSDFSYLETKKGGKEGKRDEIYSCCH